MLSCVPLYLIKGTINVRVNSFRWRSEGHFSGGGGGGGGCGVARRVLRTRQKKSDMRSLKKCTAGQVSELNSVSLP